MTNPNGSRLRHGARKKGETAPEYSTWMNMRARCNNPSVDSYGSYGGRGINVCSRWDSYENFIADMGCKPSPAHSIDRVDNSRGYEPGNCRWATITQQQNNRRSNRILVADGISATLAEHCKRTGVKYTTAHMRLQKGASVEVAINPARPAYGSLRRVYE